jgi:hypothetical protein
MGEPPQEMSIREATTFLADLPKPIACRAVVVEGKMRITTRPLESREQRLSHEQWIAAMHSGSGILQRILQSETDADVPTVLLRGGREQVTVSPSALEACLKQYLFEEQVMFSARRPTPDEQRSGIRHVVFADWFRTPLKGL